MVAVVMNGGEMSCWLGGKTAVITGAAAGIGRACATVFSERGARVAAVDINEAGVDSVVDEIRASGNQATGHYCDVSSAENVATTIEAVIAEHGRVDVLVNCAILRQGGPMESLSLEAWDRLMNVGLRGYFIVGQAVGRQMIEQRSGVIINVASTGGHHAYPGAGAYSPCKAAVIMLAKVWAMEWGKYGIRACSLSPGYVRTPMTEHLYSQPEVLAGRSASVPIGRIADPAEIAKTCAFLASDDASYVTGSDMLVDGGFAASKFIGVPGRHKPA